MACRKASLAALVFEDTWEALTMLAAAAAAQPFPPGENEHAGALTQRVVTNFSLIPAFAAQPVAPAMGTGQGSLITDLQ